MSGNGRSFGRYRLLREIGRGGEATVHLAHDPVLGRDVAIKIFPPRIGLEGDAERATGPPAGFRTELEVLARLRHPGICTLLDAGDVDGSAFLSMAYVEGRTLAERTGIDAARAVRICAEVAEALAAAHAVGIVHGDVAPRNVLLSEEDRPVVLDFGVERLLEPSAQPAGIRGPRLGGTLPYLAPERLERPPDVSSDVYGLGAVLFELVAGRPPFRAPTRAALLRRIATLEPPLLRSAAPGASRDLEAVVAKALDRDPARRYATMREFALDLGRVRDGAAVRARRHGLAARAIRFARRDPAAAALVGVLAVFLAVAVPLTALKQQSLARNLARVAEHAARASAGARVAEASLARYERLADLRRARDLEHAAHALVPPSAALLPALREWLADAEELTLGLEEHRRALAAVHARSEAGSTPVALVGTPARVADEVAALSSRLAELDPRSVGARSLRGLLDALGSSLPPPAPARSYASDSDAWHDATLTGLVDALERFADEERGIAADVARRVEDARRIEESLERSARAWEAARRSIADETECPGYGGLSIAPQLGLVPLRRDPVSGLWEFVHVLSGVAPEPAEDGTWIVAAETGVVLVLLPGGTARVGARRPVRGEGADEPHVDPLATPEEGPLDDVPLDAFFVSRFELTEAQWARVRGAHSGVEQRGEDRLDAAGATLPVTLVDWTQARDALERVGLALPTEAQWEYAARAGTTTPWWTGRDPASLERAAVFSAARSEPVGGREPNAFGLHDVAGNVAEWCRDVFARYDDPHEAGTGERRGLDEAEHRVRRGGAYPNAPNELRSARRSIGSPAARLPETGVRPARRLEP